MSYLSIVTERGEGFEYPPPECVTKFDLYDWYWSKVKHFPKNWKERPGIKLEEEKTVEATDGLRQAFEDLRETAERLAEAPATRALDWAPTKHREKDPEYCSCSGTCRVSLMPGKFCRETSGLAKISSDISTHVVINNEMKKQLIGDKLPDGRIEQIKFLLKRLTWREMEDVAKDIYQKLPAGEKPGDMARALIDWAHDVSG